MENFADRGAPPPGGRVLALLSVYGDSPFLGEQLESLRKQTHVPELLVRSDDGDGGEACRRHPELRWVDRGGPHLGLNGSLRRLLSCAGDDARCVLFCDQDDSWFPDKVAALASALAEAEARYGASTPLLVHGDSSVADESLRVVRRRFVRKWARPGDFFGALMFNKVQGACMAINGPLLRLVRDLPLEGMLYDRYVHLVAETYGRRVFVDRPLMLYRQHASNAVGAGGRRAPSRTFLSGDDRRLYAENARFIEAHRGAFDEAKERAIADYRDFFETSSPARRLELAWRYLRPYPTAFFKKCAKAFMPR